LAFYISLSLCISESVFTIKTAGLAWFVMGFLNRPEMESLPMTQEIAPELTPAPRAEVAR
jgi:hypothetical protein